MIHVGLGSTVSRRDENLKEYSSGLRLSNICNQYFGDTAVKFGVSWNLSYVTFEINLKKSRISGVSSTPYLETEGTF